MFLVCALGASGAAWRAGSLQNCPRKSITVQQHRPSPSPAGEGRAWVWPESPEQTCCISTCWIRSFGLTRLLVRDRKAPSRPLCSAHTCTRDSVTHTTERVITALPPWRAPARAQASAAPRTPAPLRCCPLPGSSSHGLPARCQQPFLLSLSRSQT